VVLWFTDMYYGGKVYASALKRYGQNESNVNLEGSLSSIPDSVVATLEKSWDLLHPEPGVYSPKFGKIKGAAFPATLCLVPSYFVSTADHGILALQSFDGARKESFGLGVVWEYFRKNSSGKWDISTVEDKASVTLYNALLDNPDKLHPGTPVMPPDSQCHINIGINHDGIHYRQQDFGTAPIRVIFTNAKYFIRPFKLSETAITDSTISANLATNIVAYQHFLNGIKASIHNQSKDNSPVWISTLEELTERKGEDAPQRNYLCFETEELEPNIFCVISAPPYAIVGMRYDNDVQKRTLWSYLLTDKSGLPHFVINEILLPQDNSLSITSAILKASSNAW
jgi:hypothetical protein